jgi:hypothetical protein
MRQIEQSWMLQEMVKRCRMDGLLVAGSLGIVVGLEIESS